MVKLKSCVKTETETKIETKITPLEIINEYISENGWYKQNYPDNKILWYRYSLRHCARNVIEPYLEKPCIIAFAKDLFGALFIMRTQRSFAMIALKRDDIWLGGQGFSGRRYSQTYGSKDFLKVWNLAKERYGNDKTKFNILDEKLYQKWMNLQIVKSLEESNR